MFSGIIEACAPILSVEPRGDLFTIQVQRPTAFDDIKEGDSIAVNGVCLTVETFSADKIQFTLGAETLKVTGWNSSQLLMQKMNLERSLRFGDRMHGHFVSGHVDAVTKVSALEKGESWIVKISRESLNSKMIWPKGSVALQGVSLTINDVTSTDFSVCLIPETLLRTNLQNLKVGDSINVEYDAWAKAFVHFQEQREASL